MEAAMRRLGFVVGVLVGVLVLGGLAQETPGPHGQLSDTRVTQPTAPAFVHPNDATSDVRDVRERLPVRQATPTSANTVPAPAGDQGRYSRSAACSARRWRGCGGQGRRRSALPNAVGPTTDVMGVLTWSA